MAKCYEALRQLLCKPWWRWISLLKLCLDLLLTVRRSEMSGNRELRSLDPDRPRCTYKYPLGRLDKNGTSQLETNQKEMQRYMRIERVITYIRAQERVSQPSLAVITV